jgi:hypothetical protein
MFRLADPSHRSTRPAQFRHVVPAVLGAAAVVAAAGCGSSGSTGSGTGGSGHAQSPASAISAAARTARQINSLTADLHVLVSGSGGTESTSGTIAEQLRPNLLLSMHITAGVAGQQTKLSGIINAQAMYLKIGSLAAELGGKHWVEIPLRTLRSGKSSFGELFQSLTNTNPMAESSLFTAAKNVHVVGTQTIDGVSTTQYAGSFAPRTALRSLPSSQRKSLGPSLRLIQGEVHFNIWIDGQHQIKQVSETERAAGQMVNTTVTFTSINQPVHITLPPASDVASLPSSLSGL